MRNKKKPDSDVAETGKVIEGKHNNSCCNYITADNEKQGGNHNE
jgi:hypothetical protein